MHVEAVQKRPGQARTVMFDSRLGATATVGPVPKEATGAGVHRGHQLELARELGPFLASCDGDGAILKGLPHGFQGPPRELG